MTTAAYPDTFRPQLRSAIRFGPPLIVRGSTTYVMKDTFTNWYYEIDKVEYFILSKMDGNRTLTEISTEIEHRYGHGLSEHAWEALFKQINQRQLLTVHDESTQLLELQHLNKRKRHSEHEGLLRRRISLVRPDGFLEKVLPWVRFAFHPLFVVPAIVAVIALEIYVVLNLHSIVLSAWNSRVHPSAIPLYALFLVLLYILPAPHETAHGLTVRRFGGSVAEMGVIWRYLSFFPYCKLDDIVLFHNRWHRVYAAFAGTFSSLLVLLPFGLLWLLLPGQSFLAELSALMLTVYNIGMLLNFFPFLELDGYFMLAHALNMPDLRRASNEFWGQKLTKLFFKQEEVVHHAYHFGPQRHRVYFYYGILSIVLTLIAMLVGGYYWINTISNLVSPMVAWLLLAGIGVYALYCTAMFILRIQALHRPSSRFSHTPAPTGVVGGHTHAARTPITDLSVH